MIISKKALKKFKLLSIYACRASCSTLLLEQKGWTELLSNDISKNQNINACLGTSFQQLLPSFFYIQTPKSCLAHCNSIITGFPASSSKNSQA